MVNFSFATAPRIHSGPHTTKQLGDIATAIGMTRVLVVTDASIAKLGLADHAIASLQNAGIKVDRFTGVEPDPKESIVLEALQSARTNEVDGLVGFGGGSSMDVAKAVALLARSDEQLADVYGVGNAKGSRLPLVQIPTTAGTGSEVTQIAIITAADGTKQGIVAEQLLADVVVLDPTLSVGLPPFPTATTGIDAMVHAIEAYTSKHKKNPYSDMLAREALRLLSQNVVRAVKHGEDISARGAMLLGAMLAGQAFANAPVAAVHALAYPLGGHYHLAHGLTNSLVLPHVLRFNMESSESLYGELARIVAPGREPTGETLAAALEELISACDLPTRLRDVDVPRDDLPMLAAESLQHQRLLVNNPRDIAEADALEIYSLAY